MYDKISCTRYCYKLLHHILRKDVSISAMLNHINHVERAQKAGLNIYFIAEWERDGAIIKHSIVPANPTCNCYSVAKAFVVTAFGILYDKGILTPNMKVYDILGDLFPENADPTWKKVTLHNVLLHKIGIDHDCIDIDNESGESYPSELDYLGILLSSPLPHQPGTVYRYSDAAYYLLSRVIERACGNNPAELLRPILMKQMKFKEFAWSVCPDGHCIGATGLYLRTEDMLKLGVLYLDKGVWNGCRIISEKWVDTVLENGYEFTDLGNGWYGKGGLNGQMLAFNYSLDRAIAWHSFDSFSHTEIIEDK